MPASLTPRQAELLAFIKSFIAERGYGPSYDEMMKHLGIKSKSGVHRLVSGLHTRKHLVRMTHRSRALHVAPVKASGEEVDDLRRRLTALEETVEALCARTLPKAA